VDTSVLAAAAVIGAGATAMMDGWNLFLKSALGIPSLDLCLLGRWIRHLPDGVFCHVSIGRAAPKPHECTVGWVAHYTIGVTLALGFVALAPRQWLSRPTPTPALIYGVVTVAAPFLVLQPALGLGIAASKAPHPARARLKSLATHLAFGAGLYLSALWLGWIQDIRS
jgi:hypothetical protein